MKSTEHLQHHLRFWAIWFVATLMVVGQLPTVSAQTSGNKISVTGENSKFEQALLQPGEFLRSLGITLEEVQRRLAVRPRILVRGAGFVHNTEFAQVLAEPAEFLENIGIDLEEAQSQLGTRRRILVQNAGFVHNMNLASPTGPQQTKSSIHVVGASFTRGVGLAALTETQSPQPLKSSIQVVGAGFLREIGLVAPAVQ